MYLTKLSRKTSAQAMAGVLAIGTLLWGVFAADSFVPEDQLMGWIAQPEITNFDLKSGTETVFQPDYERTFWGGNLYAYPISKTGIIDIAGEKWNGGAGPTLNGQDWNTGRLIVTRNATGSNVAFRFDQLSASQQTSIGSANIVNYVRGDRSNESPNGLNLRSRRYVLGDILRSSPSYVAGASGTVYVGANDGMLHAFNATDGSEIYAYIPSMLIPKLNKLAPPASTAYEHTHFVDGSPVVGDVAVGGVRKRYLAGGLGAGGKGLFGLDITNDAVAPPTNESQAASRIAWEITDASTGFADLGFTYSQMAIAKGNDGNYLLLAPNGYMSTSGKAVLFVVNATSGARIRAIDTGAGSSASPNGLSSITAIDLDSNGTVDRAYAGDLDGNMWKFDLSSSSSVNWSVTRLFAVPSAQSITSAPAITAHPRGGHLLAFGTGRMFSVADERNTATHAIYGIADGPAYTTSQLQTQTLTEGLFGSGTTARRVRTVSVNAVDWATKKGWVLPLPAGERVMGDRAALASGRLFIKSYNPTVSTTTTIGENWISQLDIYTGGGSVVPIIDLNQDNAINASDLLAGTASTGAAAPVSLLLQAGLTSQPLVTGAGAFLRDIYGLNPNVAPTTIPTVTSTSTTTGTPPVVGSGVSGGHFDVDLYFHKSCSGVTCSTFENFKHFHEYDDKFDVTGVNMLAASSSTLNLSNASSKFGASTDFKVLIMGQYLSPAATFAIGTATFIRVPNLPSYPYSTTATVGTGTSAVVVTTNVVTNTTRITALATTVLGSLTTYKSNTIGVLAMNLPTDAFASKDWWGDGGSPRAGLIPTQTGCVNKTKDGLNATPGRFGELRNGALTVQLIRASTPASALELNHSGGDLRYGWRVKTNTSDYSKYVLAEWSYFWHHPNGACYKAGDAWVQNAPQDLVASSTTPSPRDAGSSDPRIGSFGNGLIVTADPGTLGGSSVITPTILTNVVTEITGGTRRTITYSDGTVIVITRTSRGDGTSQETTTRTKDGVTVHLPNRVVSDSAGSTQVDPLSLLKKGKVGRLSWQELIAQ